MPVSSYANYQKSSRITWIRRPNAQSWFGAFGGSLDALAAQLKTGIKLRFPDYATTDAQAAIGNERGIVRITVGPEPTRLEPGTLAGNALYAARLKAAWVTWSFAGSAYAVLRALYVAGYPDASGNGRPYLLQYNGLIHSLDNSGNLVIANAIGDHWTAGDDFDGNGDQWANQFALLFPSPLTPTWTSPPATPGTATTPAIPEVNRIRAAVLQWKASKALFRGIWVQTGGKIWGWPTSIVWGSGVWGGSSVVWAPELQ